ncbi:MAG: sodium-dependent transporter [candidate division KSB1 bacterium]|nr:sodium-dependent transporter [candidate division KSB1 bacterium]
MERKLRDRGSWSSKFGFIMAAAGSAIGLGNIWRFPYLTGQNGGAAFVLVYLLCVFLIGFPVMLNEFAVGRYTRKNPVGALKALNPTGYWKWVGGLGVLTGFVILSYYSVVAGWTVGYLMKILTGALSQWTTTEVVANSFGHFIASPLNSVGYLALFILLTMAVVVGGVKGGIERWCKILMPILLGLLILLVVRSVTLPGSGKGLLFYLKPDFSVISGKTVLMALGQAFFSLSLGMGAMMTYGSYISKEDNLVTSGFWVCLGDTLIAVLAGLALFPAVFAFGLQPEAGPKLIFIVLPAVFSKIPAGTGVGALFFLLLAIAALTSTVSLLEVVTAYLVDDKGWPRHKAVFSVGFLSILFGSLSALSQGAVKGLGALPLFNKPFLDLMDMIFGNYSLSFGAFRLVVFVGWKWGIKKAVEELKMGNPEFPYFGVWAFLIRFVCPLAVAFVLMGMAFGWI